MIVIIITIYYYYYHHVFLMFFFPNMGKVWIYPLRGPPNWEGAASLETLSPYKIIYLIKFCLVLGWHSEIHVNWTLLLLHYLIKREIYICLYKYTYIYIHNVWKDPVFIFLFVNVLALQDSLEQEFFAWVYEPLVYF